MRRLVAGLWPLPWLMAGAVLFYAGLRVGATLQLTETKQLTQAVRQHIEAQESMQCIWVRPDSAKRWGTR